MAASWDPAELTYLGRSTVFIGLDGVRFLTDPSLPAPARFSLSRRAPVALPAVDAVLISHGHSRHLDLGTLRRLPGEPRFFAGSREAEMLRRAGLRRVEEIVSGDVIGIGGVVVHAVAASHGSLHAAFPPRHDPIGYLIDGSSSIYFAGDSLPSAGVPAVRGVDIALLPVAPVLQYVGHLSPTDAAGNAVLAEPRVVVPIHWAGPDSDEPAPLWMSRREGFTAERLEADLRRAFEAAGVAAELRILRPGYSTTVEPRIPHDAATRPSPVATARVPQRRGVIRPA